VNDGGHVSTLCCRHRGITSSSDSAMMSYGRSQLSHPPASKIWCICDISCAAHCSCPGGAGRQGGACEGERGGRWVGEAVGPGTCG